MSGLSEDGYALSWLEAEKAMGGRSVLQGTVEEMQAQFKVMVETVKSLLPPPDPSVKTRDETADGVPVRIYTPEGAEGKKLPLGLFFHGGGYVMGDLDSEDGMCRILAKNGPCIIVNVHYRLGPQFKHPTMLDDCVTVFNWAHKNAASLGGDPSKMFTSGGSAGGGLALTTADQVITAGSSIKGILALVPVAAHPDSVPAEYKAEYTAYEENASGVPVIDSPMLKTVLEATGASPHDEKVFVTLSKNLKNFPRTYLVTCGKDPLRDDGKLVKKMLDKEGVEAKLDHYPGLPHYFWLTPMLPETGVFMENLVKGLKWIIES